MKSNSLVCWSAQYSLLHLLPGFAPEKSISLRKSKVLKKSIINQFFSSKIAWKIKSTPAPTRWRPVLSCCSPPWSRSRPLRRSAWSSFSQSPTWCSAWIADLLVEKKYHNQKSLSHLCLALLIEELRSSSFLKSCRLEDTGFWEFAQKWSILRKKYFPHSLIPASKGWANSSYTRELSCRHFDYRIGTIRLLFTFPTVLQSSTL